MKKVNISKKVLTSVLAAAMLLTLCLSCAFADDAAALTAEEEALGFLPENIPVDAVHVFLKRVDKMDGADRADALQKLEAALPEISDAVAACETDDARDEYLAGLDAQLVELIIPEALREQVAVSEDLAKDWWPSSIPYKYAQNFFDIVDMLDEADKETALMAVQSLAPIYNELYLEINEGLFGEWYSETYFDGGVFDFHLIQNIDLPVLQKLEETNPQAAIIIKENRKAEELMAEYEATLG